jgi:hypothetical protein
MKRILALAASFFRPQAIVSPLPGGIVPDKVGAWGLFGLMANANAYSQGQVADVTSATAGNTLTAAQLMAGVISLNTGAGGGFAVTLPTTAQILTALGRATIPTDGSFSKVIRFINNNVGQTATITAADASTTITGTATVATNIVRHYLMNVPSGGTTITLTNMGGITL